MRLRFTIRDLLWLTAVVVLLYLYTGQARADFIYTGSDMKDVLVSATAQPHNPGTVPVGTSQRASSGSVSVSMFAPGLPITGGEATASLTFTKDAHSINAAGAVSVSSFGGLDPPGTRNGATALSEYLPHFFHVGNGNVQFIASITVDPAVLSPKLDNFNSMGGEVIAGFVDDTGTGTTLAQVDTTSLTDTQTSLVYSAVIPVKDGVLYNFLAGADFNITGLILPHGLIATFNVTLIDLPAVPEPSTLALALAGLLVAMLLRRA